MDRAFSTTIALAAALLFSALVATPASAHARLLRTTPTEGARLRAAPATVAFEFDERVRSSSPADVSGGTLRGTLKRPARLKDSGREVIVSLPSGLGRGVYSVTWHVVSDDGHQELGTLVFGVGRSPAGASSGATERTQGNGGLDVARWLLLLGALAAGGLSGVRFALAQVRSDRNLRTVPGAARLRLAALLVVAGGAMLALLTLPDALSTRFGIVAAGSGALALLAAGSAALGAGVLADAAAIALVAGPPLAGHALSPGRLDAVVLPVDLIHTAAAAAWLGGVLWLVLLASAALRAGGAALGPSAREFSRLALVVVAALAASGVVRAVLELQRPGELVTTGYGRLLLAKSAIFVVLLALARWNRARLLPRLDGAKAGAATHRLRQTTRAEALLLAAITACVALLGSTTPPRSAAAVAASPAPPRQAAGAGTMVFGREADELAVGAAVRRQGATAIVTATVLGADGAPDNHVTVSVGTTGTAAGTTPAARCGAGRYCASVRAAPDLAIRVRRASGRVSAVTVALASDPQPARAASLVAAAAVTLRAQRSLVIQEHLAQDAHTAIDTQYRVLARDRLAYTTRGGGQAIIVGDRRWDRAASGRPWQPGTQQRLNLPAPDWDSAEDASLLGAGRVAGRPVWNVSFSDPTIPAWFEVAIDKQTGLPLVEHMTAAAHFMVRRFERFGARLRIAPPRR